MSTSTAVLDAAEALLALLPQPHHKSYATHYARLQADELRRAVARERELNRTRPEARTLSVVVEADPLVCISTVSAN